MSKTIFPIGKINKKDVRIIAKKNNLVTADKKDSQGLCFIGKVKLPDFLQQSLKPKNGNVVLIDKSYYGYKSYSNPKGIKITSKKIKYNKSDGEIIGHHNGAHFYTIGQRKGLSIGGRVKPLYVLSTDVVNNIIYVGEGSDHPGLFRSSLKVPISKMHFISDPKKIEVKNLKARIRYRQALQDVSFTKNSENYYFNFKNPQKAITSGQFIALYDNEELICSGVID